MATSARGLARAVGRSHTVVERWIEREDWNQPRQPPWDVERAKAWAAVTLGANPADVWKQPAAGAAGGNGDTFETLRKQPLTAARLKLALVRADMLTLQKAILAGEYVLRTEVEEALIRRVHAVRAGLEALPRQLAGQLAGQPDERVIEETIDQAIRNALEEFSRHLALPAPPLRENPT